MDDGQELPSKYDQWLDLALKAELAARNGEWRTAYTYSKQAAELALKFSEVSRLTEQGG